MLRPNAGSSGVSPPVGDTTKGLDITDGTSEVGVSSISALIRDQPTGTTVAGVNRTSFARPTRTCPSPH